MIRNLLATTAVAALLTTGAYAQTTTPPTNQDPAAAPMTDGAAPVEATETPGPQPIEGHLASNIIGENVYNGVTDEAENIGTVNDIVLNPEGQAELIVVGVGGFLGLGQKDVALAYDEIEWAQRDDGSAWLVVSATREQLEQQEAFDRDAYDPNDPESMAATGTAVPATDGAADTAAAPAETTAPAAGGMAAAPATDATTAPASDSMAAAPAATDQTETAAIDRSTLTPVDAATLSADELIGTTVYGMDDENIGSISDVIMTPEGEVDFVTLDVGGFLGMGAREVALDMDNLEFLNDGDDTYLYTSFTREQLEAQPEYDEATFAEQRDNQLMINQAN